MNERRVRRQLAYILESIELIESRAAVGREALFADTLVRDAILYRLETLSDAAGKLPVELRNAHPELPWHEITGFRNRVSHGYLELDLDVVWRVITDDLPVLKQVAERELNRLGT